MYVFYFERSTRSAVQHNQLDFVVHTFFVQNYFARDVYYLSFFQMYIFGIIWKLDDWNVNFMILKSDDETSRSSREQVRNAKLLFERMNVSLEFAWAYLDLTKVTPTCRAEQCFSSLIMLMMTIMRKALFLRPELTK